MLSSVTNDDKLKSVCVSARSRLCSVTNNDSFVAETQCDWRHGCSQHDQYSNLVAVKQHYTITTDGVKASAKIDR